MKKENKNFGIVTKKLFLVCSMLVMTTWLSSAQALTVTVQASSDGMQSWFDPNLCQTYPNMDWQITLSWDNLQGVNQNETKNFVFALPHPLHLWDATFPESFGYSSGVYVEDSIELTWHVTWSEIPDIAGKDFLVNTWRANDWGDSPWQAGHYYPNYTIFDGLDGSINHISPQTEFFKKLRLRITNVDYGHYIPEPATMMLLGLGSLVLLRRRRLFGFRLIDNCRKT